MKTPRFKINWRYAIGEFLIVVIGILVAFQLDSWKEDRDEAQLVNEYLTDIRVGLETDSVFYQMANNYFDTIKVDMTRTKAYLEAGQLDLPPDGQKALRNLTDWYRIYISNTAFEDLNNSGRLNLIADKTLRYNLIAYYQYIDFVRILDEEYNSSLNLMKDNLLGKLTFHDGSQLVVPETEVDLILNYLDHKQTIIASYLGHRSYCDKINADIRASMKPSTN